MKCDKALNVPEPNASEVGQETSIGAIDLCSGGVRKDDCDSTMRVKWSCSYKCEFGVRRCDFCCQLELRWLDLRGWGDGGGPEGRSGVGLAAARARGRALVNVTCTLRRISSHVAPPHE